jgi:hypothetical protein
MDREKDPQSIKEVRRRRRRRRIHKEILTFQSKVMIRLSLYTMVRYLTWVPTRPLDRGLISNAPPGEALLGFRAKIRLQNYAE